MNRVVKRTGPDRTQSTADNYMTTVHALSPMIPQNVPEHPHDPGEPAESMANGTAHVRDMTLREASEFWDTHSVADLPSHVVEFDYAPGEHTRFVAVANGLYSQLEEKARERGVSVETLVDLLIREKGTM